MNGFVLEKKVIVAIPAKTLGILAHLLRMVMLAAKYYAFRR